MAFKHNTSDTADGILTQSEYESTSGHILDSQAAGDMIVADTTTTMTRLAVGSADEVLTSDGSTPTYSKITTSNINASTLVIESEGIGSNDNDTTIPTSAAVKAYVDSQIGSNNELSEVLGNGNSTGGTNIVVTAGDVITVDTINETTAASGVTIDSVLLKDNVVTSSKIVARTGSSGQTVDSNADEGLFEGSGNSGISILSGATSYGNIFFGDSGADNIGIIRYDHTNDRTEFLVNGQQPLTLTAGYSYTADGQGLVVGHTEQVSVGYSAQLEVLGTATADSSILLGLWNTSNTAVQRLSFLKSGGAAIGTTTQGIVADGESLGMIEFYGDDGFDYASRAALITAEVDGTPGTNDMPGRLLFSTTAVGAASPTEALRIDSSQGVYIGETSNANMTVGLTINQGANDNEILALKSSDIAHRLTGITEADTYAAFEKNNGASGGLEISSFVKSASGGAALKLSSHSDITSSADTAKNGSGFGFMTFDTWEKDGTTGRQAATDTNANLFSFRNGTTSVFLIDIDGDYFYDGTGTAYDFDPVTGKENDDLDILRSFTLVTAKPETVLQTEFDQWLNTKESDLVRLGILGDTVANGGLVNGAKLAALHTGAIHQMNTKHMSLAEEVKSLKAEIKALTEGK